VTALPDPLRRSDAQGDSDQDFNGTVTDHSRVGVRPRRHSVSKQLFHRCSDLSYRLLSMLVVLALLCPVLGGSASADSPMPQNQVPGWVESTARRFANGLRQQGYEVARGYFKLYTQNDCPYSYQVLHSCLGNNPAAPYVLPIVPAWPDEWVDPGTAGMAGPTVAGYNPSYRLDPREAVVILAQLPPPARYFGLQTYVVSRPGEWDEDSAQYEFVQDHVPAMLNTFFTKLPNNQDRLQLFADLSNPINNVVIENGSGAVWDQVRTFVITPDQTMDTVVRQALAGIGIADEDVFTEQIPDMLGDTPMAIGLDERSDDFLTLLSYAMPDDGGGDRTRSNAWRERLPMVVLRIRDTRPDHQLQPYPWAAFETRLSATPPETVLAPNLAVLATAICHRWEQTCQPSDLRPLLNMRASQLSLTGPACVKVGMNCLAPTEDTAYFISARLPLPDDRVYAVVGALGTQTGNATYVGLGLNSSVTQLGFANIDDDKLAGSAAEYTAVPNYDRFFLQYFARDCTGLDALTGGNHCYAIGDQLPDCADPTDLTCTMLVLSVRDYLLPGSQRGPEPKLTLNPMFIPLHRGTPEAPNRLWLPLMLR